MKNRGLEQIVDEALGAVEGSSGESRVGEFRKIARAMRVPFQSAPKAAIERAKAIMPQVALDGLRAKLVYCSLQPQAVRSTVTDGFQMVFEAEACKVRMMFSPSGDRWDVMGEIEGPIRKITQGGRRLPAQNGRFAFLAPTLKQTGLVIELEGGSVQIPSALEAALGHGEPD